MEIIKIGEPIVTKTGTVIKRYVENGRLYKSVDFTKSINKNAKQKGLVKTVTLYGEGNRPERFYDTFEHTISRAAEPAQTPVTKPIQVKKKVTKKSTKPTVAQKNEPVQETPVTPKKVEVKPTEKTLSKSKEVTTKPTEDTKPSGLSQADNPKIVPISVDSFNGEIAKKLYAKIHKYVKLAGSNGSIKNAKLMSEEGVDFGTQSIYSNLKKSADVVLSVNRVDEKLHVTLGRNNLDESRKFTLFDAIFNSDGQMTEGSFPLEHMTFKRSNNNVRRLKKHNENFLPVAGNDREWQNEVSNISPSDNTKLWYVNDDNAVGGAFEIFMELARLHTSILK